MATLLLTAAGTAIGGPLGGSIGALVGQQIDGAIFGGSGREGPRLKELSATTSSYGQPISRHHGTMRAPGTIIWATDLNENRERSGGKGQPKTTTYSYSSSFAVILASRPITGIGRIWADGNLLRGNAGDLKTGGSMRIYNGRGDQAPDPLIVASEGSGCPAFRGCAYAVFEDLQLADFGNRLPALTFEVIADDGAISLTSMLGALLPDSTSDLAFPQLTGFSLEGGAISQTIAILDQVYPVAIDAGSEVLSLSAARATSDTPILLPEAASAWEAGDFGEATGSRQIRDAADKDRPDALRYYDTDRDYQPGMQRAGGRARPGRSRTIEFPGALNAENARGLANAASQRAAWKRETLSWRLAELDPKLMPGKIVRAPGVTGLWRINGWEWRERGVELELVRLPPVASATMTADAGTVSQPFDELPWQTLLAAFELPWDGRGSSETPALFAAASAGGAGWSGAALYTERGTELVPIGTTTRRRSVLAKLAAPLGSSTALLFEPAAVLEVDVLSGDMGFAPATIAALASGANRMLVGEEIVQFACAEQIAPLRWRLSGLLRGRGGTERVAQAGHIIGTDAILIDETLVQLDALLVSSSAATVVAAIGLGDTEPVTAPLNYAGATQRPLVPVHPKRCDLVDGGFELHWTRRARGAWDWPDEVDTPLVEETELYRLGVGPVSAPVRTWRANSPQRSFSAAEVQDLTINHSGEIIWVRQIGSHAQSYALALTRIA